MRKNNLKLIIIGGTSAGPSAAAKARRVNEFADILLFEKSKNISYATCGLPYYLSGVIPHKYQLEVQKPAGFSKRFNINLYLQNEVIDINPKNKEITVKNLVNDEITLYGYDKLIYCCGARPIKPPIPGVDLKNIFVLRNLDDVSNFYNAITANNPSSKRIVIVGAGLIGLEVAENLNLLGLKVVVVELFNQVLPLFDYEMAKIIESELVNKGIKVITSNGVKEFLGVDNVQKVILQDDTEIQTDFVLLSVGIRPNTELAKKAGIKLGESKAIIVNQYMETNITDIYAAGDCTETFNLITNKHQWIPLATIANKQGRTAGANAMGRRIKFRGALGSAIAKICDLTVGITGITEKIAKKEGYNYAVSYIHPRDHANYYPNSEPLSMKIIIDKDSKRIIGAQIIGKNGVDKRIDVISTAILGNLTVDDFVDLDLCYAPPYSTAKDPVIMAGFVAQNILSDEVKTITVNELKNILDQNTPFQLVDVRRDDEWETGRIKKAIHINLNELRSNLHLLKKEIPIYVYCKTGLRSYIAYRILTQYGYDVINVSGGLKSWEEFGFKTCS
ncbi:MAG: FAD-dependent oxidoreductase [Candidatus Helarchaeota archaeon]